MQPGFKATKHVPRDVNPVFKSTVMITDVEESDLMQFLIKDVGVFEATHMGGIGPKLIASGTMNIGT